MLFIPWLSILPTRILPMVVFVVIAQFVTKKLMDRAGGGSGAELANIVNA